MDECPHCGQPIEDDDESCQHCGSDFETGWRSDTDYYAVELPEDDLEADLGYREGAAQDTWQAVTSGVLVTIAATLFLAASFIAFPKSAMPFVFVVALAASWVAFHRKISPRRKRRTP